jgi:hypothetical protein
MMGHINNLLIHMVEKHHGAEGVSRPRPAAVRNQPHLGSERKPHLQLRSGHSHRRAAEWLRKSRVTFQAALSGRIEILSESSSIGIARPTT